VKDAKCTAGDSNSDANREDKRDTLRLTDGSQFADVFAVGNVGSVRAFCDRRDLTETAFYFWRKELRKRGGEPASRPTSPTFVPVTVMPAATFAVEVRCPSGHVVCPLSVGTFIGLLRIRFRERR
jgi:hypothetical protein